MPPGHDATVAPPSAEPTQLGGNQQTRRDQISRALLSGSKGRSETGDPRPRLVLGVTSFNRVEYVGRLLETFAQTRSEEFAWTVIVADDGSSDGTWTFLSSYEPDDFDLILIRNHGARIAGQTNTIFMAAEAIGFDFGFKADDDIFFDKPGWDRLYYQASVETGMDHLVYHNSSWKPAAHLLRRPGLVSQTTGLGALGCFFTFTPRLLSSVGLFDEMSFPVRGYSHLDYTMRACRAGFNEAPTLWDADGASDAVMMWGRDDYLDVTDWSSPEIVAVTTSEERSRRLDIVSDENRVFVGEDDAIVRKERVAVLASGPNRDRHEVALAASGWFWTPGLINSDYDEVLVLNLADDERKWAATCEQLAGAGIAFRRFPGVFGGEDSHLRDWRYYQAEGLFRDEEINLGRKLIQSPGAWGYLRSMEAMLEFARTHRIRNLLLLDDDIRLHIDLADLYSGFREQIQELPDVLFLGGTQRQWDDLEFVSERAYAPDRHLDGSFAVGLSSSTYENLLREISEYTGPFDSGPLRRVALSPETTALVSIPNLVIPDIEHSYIRMSRDIEDHAAMARWDLASYRTRESATPRALGPDELVSVVVPALDGTFNELMDTVEALRAQTHGKLEILVAMASDARHVAEAEDLPDQDPRVTAVFLDGDYDEVAVTNLLLSLARGSHLSVVPAGTVSRPNRFATSLEATAAGYISAGSFQSLCLARPPGKGTTVQDLDRWTDFFEQKSVNVVDLFHRKIIEQVGGLRHAGEQGVVELIARAGADKAPQHFTSEEVRSVRETGDTPSSVDEPWDDFGELLATGSIPPYVPLRSGVIEFRTVVAGNSQVPGLSEISPP